jgi:arylformamidase
MNAKSSNPKSKLKPYPQSNLESNPKSNPKSPIQNPKWHDLSRPLTPTTAVFPGDTPVTIHQVMRIAAGDSCNVSSISLSVHAGTHVDAPRHYADDAPGVDQVSLDVLIGPARVVSVAGTVLTTGMLEQLDLGGVTRLLLHTAASAVPDDVWEEGFLSITPEAAAWLGQHGVQLIGTDTPSVDPATSQDLPAHKTFLRYDVIIVENLSLDGVADGDYELIALPVRIAGSDAAPARVLLREVAA